MLAGGWLGSRDCDGGDDHKKCCGQPSPDIYHSGISSYDTQHVKNAILRTNDKRVFLHQLRLIHPELSCNILSPHSLSYLQVRQRGAGLSAAARRHEPGPGRGPGQEQCTVLYCTVLYCTVQVKSRRDVRPNDGFLQQLIAFEQTCRRLKIV